MERYRAFDEAIFDSWAREIDGYVTRTLPGRRLKRNLGDVYRWIYADRECQMHAVSESHVKLLTLRREGRWPLVQHAPLLISIAPDNGAAIAHHIVRWLQS